MNLGKSKLWTKEYIIITLVNFLVAINFYLLIVIISKYAIDKFNAPRSQAGLAVSIFIIGALVTRLFVGKWLIRFGYKRILLIGIIASIFTSLAYFWISGILFLHIVRLLHGATLGIISTAASTIVADIIPKERRGEGIGFYSLSQTLALSIGPFFAMFLSKHGSYDLIFLVCVIAPAASLIIAAFLSLRKIELTEEQINSMQGFKINHFVEYRAVPISTICLLIYLCYSSIVSFLPVYAEAINLVDTASFFFIVYAIVVLISRPLAGMMFDSKGENSVMYPAILIFAIGMFMFSQSYHGYILLAAAALIGLGFGAVQSSAQTIAVKVTPQHRLGMANSTFFIFSDLGMCIGPLLVGFMIPFLNYRGMYMVMSIVALVCLLLYYLLNAKTTSCVSAASDKL